MNSSQSLHVAGFRQETIDSYNMLLAQVGEELEGCLKCLGAASGAGYDMMSHKGFIAQGKIAHVMSGLFLLGVCWRQPRKSINYLDSCSKAPIISQLDMLNLVKIVI